MCFANRRINAWGAIFSTTNTPSYHTSLHIGVRIVLRWTDKWTSSVSLTGVFSVDASSTDERIMKFILLSKPCLSQFILTLIVVDNRKINLLQNNLVLSSRSKLILTPTSSKAGGSIKEFVSLRKAHSVDVAGKNKFF